MPIASLGGVPARFRGPQNMATIEAESSEKAQTSSSAAFNYSYVVLGILMLLTTGATVAFFESSGSIDNDTGRLWTPVVFLIGLCVSLLIFGVTYREISARRVLHQKTLDLIASQKENEKLLAAEQSSRIAAEQANSAKDEFLAVLSHELRTPLNAIAGWNRILKTPGVSEETRRIAVEKIDKNLRLQTGIVEQLLNFSHIMSSNLVVDRAPLVMRSLFEDAVASAADSARQKGVALVETDTLDGECVLGDRHNLKLAITHVLNNAVKFTPTGGNIEVKAYAESGHLKLVIKDSGIGIEPDAMAHIFDEYRQSERASTRRYGGLGLGLTIAEHIVKLHHGTIDVFSAGIGHGSTFTITIPTQG